MNNQFLQTSVEIKKWLDKMNIKGYTIIADKIHGFIVDVDKSVDLEDKNLTFIPVKFNKVKGYFSCANNKLKTLKGCPESVGESFGCLKNQLTTLQYCPQSVGGHFFCSYNQLTTLEYAPQKVGGDFDCSFNKLHSLEYCPTTINGYFNCIFNELRSLEHCPENVYGDFSCCNNQLETLEFFPKKIQKNFYGNNNPLFCDLQHSLNFKELYAFHKQVVKIKKEKKQLQLNIQPFNSSKQKNIHKL